MSQFMNNLRSTRPVFQQTQAQPMVASVQKVEYKERNVTLWSRAAKAIHATRDMLSAPVYGSTKPNDFITIQGQAPRTPVVVAVPSVAGSNIPQGGLQ